MDDGVHVPPEGEKNRNADDADAADQRGSDKDRIRADPPHPRHPRSYSGPSARATIINASSRSVCTSRNCVTATFAATRALSRPANSSSRLAVRNQTTASVGEE